MWWAEDLSRVPPLASILEMGRQLVYDSRQWFDIRRAVQSVESWAQLDLIDVNWRRLTAVRRAVALAAANSDASAWSPDTVRIPHRWADRAMA